MSAAATAANEALAQLAQARLISDQTARASAREIESLSNELDAERNERRRLETALQQRMWQERSGAAAAAQAAPAPQPGRPARPRAAARRRPARPRAAARSRPACAPRPRRSPSPPSPRPRRSPSPRRSPRPAPQPVAAQPAAAQPVAARRPANHEADSKKVRGLRRMIAALRR